MRRSALPVFAIAWSLSGVACDSSDKSTTDTEDTEPTETESDDPTESESDDPTESESEPETDMYYLIGYVGHEGTVTFDTADQASFTGTQNHSIYSYFDKGWGCLASIPASGVSSAYECEDCSWTLDIHYDGLWDFDDDSDALCDNWWTEGDSGSSLDDDPFSIGFYESYVGTYTTYSDVMAIYYVTYGWYIQAYADFDEDKGTLSWYMWDGMAGYYYY